MARKGAEHRYEELKAEIAHLVKSFPHLARTAGRDVRKAAAKVAARSMAAVEAEAPKIRRRARKMSAAARKAVSARMKKYWAAKRATKTGAKK